ncbi:MAG TPA: hypothetical protein VLV78_02700 [Thermoanaerobaculia bacterium]|nr:hypothetical protein [Thermoanaerobaculia bacterium]
MRMGMMLFAAFVSLPLAAQRATRIEYGKPVELRNVKIAYISTTDDDDLAKEARRQLMELLPALAFAGSEEEGDVTLAFSRKPNGNGNGDGSAAKQFTTTMYVARATGGMTIRVYLDATSTKTDLAEAVSEVIKPACNLLQKANPRQLGSPAIAVTPQNQRMIHTTAGLRPGLSKREVLDALGVPTNVTGRATYTQTWVYKTSDGDIRLVFGGERLVAVTVPEKK